MVKRQNQTDCYKLHCFFGHIAILLVLYVILTEEVGSLFREKRNEEDYFDLFVSMSELTCTAARDLNDLINNYTDIAGRIDAVKDVEHACDQKEHIIVRQLNQSFITPIDQEDINEIAKHMDTITDAIEDTAYSFKMFNVHAITEDAKKLSALIVQCTEELMRLMTELRHWKTSKTINQSIIEVNRIENEGDEVYRNAMTSLFSGGMDTLDVVKWKDIYGFFEQSLDACEDVANTVEGVLMKNA